MTFAPPMFCSSLPTHQQLATGELELEARLHAIIICALVHENRNTSLLQVFSEGLDHSNRRECTGRRACWIGFKSSIRLAVVIGAAW